MGLGFRVEGVYKVLLQSVIVIGYRYAEHPNRQGSLTIGGQHLPLNIVRYVFKEYIEYVEHLLP